MRRLCSQKWQSKKSDYFWDIKERILEFFILYVEKYILSVGSDIFVFERALLGVACCKNLWRMIDDHLNSWKFKTASQKHKKGSENTPRIQHFFR